MSYKKDYIERRADAVMNKLIPKPVKTGKGLVNSIIDNLPIPLHSPGYNYLGPGTPLDLHLEKGVKPVNKLDEAAMYHDIAYSKSDNLDKRHEADYKLQEDAWKRFTSDDAGLGEKANAWLTTTAMRAKRAIGAGVSKKPRYTEYPANLDEKDLEKLKKAKTSNKGVTVVFRFNRTKEAVVGDLQIPLTTKQLRNVKTKHRKRQNATVRITTNQMKNLASREGGWLPLVDDVEGLVTAGVNAWNNKKANDKLVEERIRHNKAMEEIAAKNNKAKTGGSLKNTKGNGLYAELLKKKKIL